MPDPDPTKRMRRNDPENPAWIRHEPGIPGEVVEDFARRRWNANRQAIIDSGTAVAAGALWDEIEPTPNGADARTASRTAARVDLEFAAPSIGKQERERVRKEILDPVFLERLRCSVFYHHDRPASSQRDELAILIEAKLDTLEGSNG